MQNQMTKLEERQTQLLSSAIGQTQTRISVIAEEADVSERTVYSWLSGESTIQFKHARHLIKSPAIHQTIKLAVARLLLEDTGMDVIFLDESGLDANGDGRVDCDDALMHASEAAEQMTTGVRDLVKARSDGRVTEGEYDQVIGSMDNNISKTHAAKRALEIGYQAQPKRHRLGLTDGSTVQRGALSSETIRMSGVSTHAQG